MNTKPLKKNPLNFIAFSLLFLIGLAIFSSAQAKLSWSHLSQDDITHLSHVPPFELDLKLAGSLNLDVDTILDSNLPSYQVCTATPNDCTLRGAVSRANSDTANTYVINLPSGTYTLEGFLDDNNLSGDLDIFSDAKVTIIGTSSTSTIIQSESISSGIGGVDRIFQVFSEATLSVQGVTIQNGGYVEYGGGIYNNGGHVIVYDSRLTSNYAGSGGGIFSENGFLLVEKTTLWENEAQYGGGIRAHNTATMILGSTFRDNYASYGGGGLQIYGGLGTTSVANSTFANNQTGGDGGGIYMISGEVSITNSTISGNSGVNGGGLTFDSGEVTLQNSIIANSVSGQDCVSWPSALFTNTSNLIEDGSCEPAFNGDPGLGPLQDNGGPTLTHAVWPGSLAFDNANSALCPQVDQRYLPRPQGNGCDIGAFEYQVGKPTPSPTCIPSPTSTPGITPTPLGPPFFLPVIIKGSGC